METFLGSTSTITSAPIAAKNSALDDLHSLTSFGVNSSSSNSTQLRQYDCLNRITGQGLQMQYRFPRTSYQRASHMVHVELIFSNTTSNKEFYSIKFVKSKSNVIIEGFDEIGQLVAGATTVVSMGIDFNDKTQAATFEIAFDGQNLSTPLSISCHVGELIEQKFLNEHEFNQNQSKTRKIFVLNLSTCSVLFSARLRGMNEVTGNVNLNENQLTRCNFANVQSKMISCANVCSVPSSLADSTIFR